MSSINILIPKAKRIEINGVEFEIHIDGHDVVQKALNMESEFKGFNPAKMTTAAMRRYADKIAELVQYVDTALGEGAYKKITKGRALAPIAQVSVAMQVLMAVMKIYAEQVDAEYE